MTEGDLKVRRVVMREDATMSSVFDRVEEVTALVEGRRWEIWGWDTSPVLPTLPSEGYEVRSSFPPPGGVRVTALRLGAELESPTPKEIEAVQRLTEAEPAGLVVVSPETGMHRTDTVDVGVVVSGSVLVEAADGTTQELWPGDVYIQEGATHTWKPGSKSPAHIVFVVLGVERPTP